jgi:renalase
MTKHVAVIGAGVSGLAATRALVDKGFQVSLFDQGKTIGGRLGIRTLKEIPYKGRNIDVGAAYFTISDPLFKEVADSWIRHELVRAWVDTFTVLNVVERQKKSGPMRYVAAGGLKNILFYELSNLKSQINHYQDFKVKEIKIQKNIEINDKEYDAVVLALPAPQAARLFVDDKIKNQLSNIKFNPVLVSWLTTNQNLDFNGIFVNENQNITLLINEGSKQNDLANICTIYSTHEFAKAEIEDLDLAKSKLLQEAIEILKIKQPIIESGIMRWTLAQPTPGERPKLPSNVAIVGDAFSENPRIEAAWLDGSRVLDQLRAIL